MASEFAEHYFTSQDGLRLYYREYGDAALPGVPLLCLPGLVRNSVDFHEFALRYADRHRILCPDLRGRGRSERSRDHTGYAPQTHLFDLSHLLMASNCHKAVVVGTSFGGILTMILGSLRPTALAGVILNDIGPEIDARGVARIAGYVGKDIGRLTVAQAAEKMALDYGVAFPDYDDARWLDEVRRCYLIDKDGFVSLNYDPQIGRALNSQAGDAPDFWPFFRALRRLPVLALRGALSDILSAETFNRMAHEHSGLVRAEIPERGHTPTLAEPESLAAIDPFIARFAHDDHR